jgi:hypothetical protein
MVAGEPPPSREANGMILDPGWLFLGFGINRAEFATFRPFLLLRFTGISDVFRCIYVQEDNVWFFPRGTDDDRLHEMKLKKQQGD